MYKATFSFCVLFLLVGMLTSLAQPGKQYILYSAEVLGNSELAPQEVPKVLVDVHVRNTRSRWIAVTDASGLVTMDVLPGDTLVFTRIGYKKGHVIIPVNNTLPIYHQRLLMKESVLELEAVQITGLPDVPNTILARPKRDTIRMGYAGKPVEIKPNGFRNPLSYLYERYGKVGRQKRVLAELEAEKKAVEIYKQQWWQYRPLVKQLTRLEGQALDRFMQAHRPRQLFLLSASKYEMATYILASHEQFASYDLGEPLAEL